nr:hypothetical protein [Megavirus caiporensis]
MNLPKFDIDTINSHEKILVCGKRLTGKTTLINKLIEKISDNKQIQHLYLITPKSTNGEYNFINHSELQNKVTCFININTTIIKKINSECDKNNGENIIIIEDIAISSYLLTDLIKIKATIILSYQFLIPYHIHSFNTFIFTKENRISNKEDIYYLAQKSFINHKYMSNFDNFNKLFDYNTLNYNALVISNFQLLQINAKFSPSKNKSLTKDYITESVDNILNRITKPKINTPIKIII